MILGLRKIYYLCNFTQFTDNNTISRNQIGMNQDSDLSHQISVDGNIGYYNTVESLKYQVESSILCSKRIMCR